LSPTEPHDEFLELCAVSTSGQLTEEEQKKLQEHLAVCQSCREALQQYEAVVGQAIPAIAAKEESEATESGPSWSQEEAEKAFFKRLVHEEKREPRNFRSASDLPSVPHRLPAFSNGVGWPQVWMLYAAGILLFLSVGFYAYRIRVHRSTDVAQESPAPPRAQNQVSLEEQLSDAGHEREIASAQIKQRDKTIADLRHQLAEQSTEINQMKAAQERLEGDLHAGDTSRQDLTRQRADLVQKLDAAQDNSHALQEKLNSLAQQSAQDAARAKASEARANDLTHLLQDRETALEQQDQLLSHDRDIRELMGARDLYIAEVSFVQIDSRQRTVPPVNWHDEHDRPVFFFELRDRYVCSWCELHGRQLILVPTPQSRGQARHIQYPDDATIVGRVTAVAMRIAEARDSSAKGVSLT